MSTEEAIQQLKELRLPEGEEIVFAYWTKSAFKGTPADKMDTEEWNDFVARTEKHMDWSGTHDALTYHM